MRMSTWHNFLVWLSYSIKAWFSLLCSHFCIYLTAELLVNTRTHTHVAVSQREGFEGPDCGAALGFLSPCHCCGSGHRQMANCHSNWEKRTQEDERVREWGERGRRTRRTDGSYQGLPCFSKEQQLRHTHADAKNLCTVLLRLCESSSLCVYVWCLECFMVAYCFDPY